MYLEKAARTLVKAMALAETSWQHVRRIGSVLAQRYSQPWNEWTGCYVRGRAGAIAGEGILKPGIGCELPTILITGGVTLSFRSTASDQMLPKRI
jgi:hypothetical protein